MGVHVSDACRALRLQAVLSRIAPYLGVNVDDLDFADLTFFQGSEFFIQKKFDLGYVELSSIRGESDSHYNFFRTPLAPPRRRPPNLCDEWTDR